MSARCDLTGKGLVIGNKVSHSQRKTKKAFKVNLQKVSLNSDALGKVSLKLAVSTLRSVDHNGGLDKYLLKTSNGKLTDKGKKLKKKIIAALEGSKDAKEADTKKKAA